MVLFVLCYIIVSSTATSRSANFTSISDAPILDSLASIHHSSKNKKPHARRYTALDKDTCCYEYLAAGNAHYKYFRANTSIMSTKTIQRYLTSSTNEVCEGIANAKGLKDYLLRNNFPLVVSCCEDATKITSAVEYDHKENKLRGLVSPLNSDGLPDTTKFEVKTPITMKTDIQEYPVGEYAYVQLAIPLAVDAAPYVLYHCCSDNRFTSADVLNRWRYTEDALRKEGIKVISNASDGDSRLLKAMKFRAGLDQEPVPSHWGSWYRVYDHPEIPMNVQDMVHAVNKFRNRLLGYDMEIGKYKISVSHVHELISIKSKDKHLITASDLNPKDKMKVEPTLKLMNPVLIDLMEKTVPGSAGTVLFLRTMRLMYRSFVEEELSPLERVHDVWAANFIVRAWRNWCKMHHKNLDQCVTTNAYLSLELDAHALISFMKDCRDRNAPEQFIVSALSSQPCEELFREVRSMSTTHQTVVNFTIKEFTQKIKRLQMKTNIMYRNKQTFTYPAHESLQKKRCVVVSLPDDEQIKIAVEKARTTAREAMNQMGIAEIDMSSVWCSSNFEPLPTEFVSFDEHVSNAEAEPMEVGFISCGSYDRDVEPENEPVYEAAEVFPACEGNLELKNSTAGNKHCFKIRDTDGKIKYIKKSTLLWLLLPERNKPSTDRTRRFWNSSAMSAKGNKRTAN